MTFANVRASSMRHCLCAPCWNTLFPGRASTVVSALQEPPAVCCHCGNAVEVVTYYRDAPSRFPCHGDHGRIADQRPTSVIESQVPCPTCGLPAYADPVRMMDPANLHHTPAGTAAEYAYYLCEFCKVSIAVPYSSVMRVENTTLGDLLDRLTRDNNPPPGYPS